MISSLPRSAAGLVLLALLFGCATTATPPDGAMRSAAPAPAGETSTVAKAPEWSFNATIIEACSCPMFCQCYFNTRPAGPGCCSNSDDPLLKTRFCRFNNAFHINRGSWGDTKLDGVEFWIAGDLGSEFDDGMLDWAILHFEPGATKEQREAIPAILGALYPAKWTGFTVGKDANIDWKSGKDVSTALLDEGRMGEIVLKRNQGMTNEPIVIQNLRYWGAPRNGGFVLMQNEVEAYRAGEKPYEFKGTNGFMINVDINSKDAGGEKKAGY